jgi:FdhE protein
MSSLRQRWMAAHPYLEPVARFQGSVEGALARAPGRRASVEWEAWREDEAEGIPVLRSAAACVDFAPAASATLGDLVEALAGAALPERVGASFREVHDVMRRTPGERARAIAWITAGAAADGAPKHAGLVKHLAWTAARSVLAPIVRGSWERGTSSWGHGHCPTCGALPAMAQLVEGAGEEGRRRLLACGCCGTRWRYRRVGCPFCDSEVPERLGILEVEGEAPLRLDVCDDCKGYLKTYTDEGEEELFLADWPTLHLDVAAGSRGFRRLGASLYDFPDDERRI